MSIYVKSYESVHADFIKPRKALLSFFLPGGLKKFRNRKDNNNKMQVDQNAANSEEKEEDANGLDEIDENEQDDENDGDVAIQGDNAEDEEEKKTKTVLWEQGDATSWNKHVMSPIIKVVQIV